MNSPLFYALRHKASGLLMPEFENGRGYSHWSPRPGMPSTIGVDGAQAGSVRLFPTRKGADNARVAWARGVFERGYTTTDGVFGPEDYDYVRPKDAGRKKDDLEIVTATLVIGEPSKTAISYVHETKVGVPGGVLLRYDNLLRKYMRLIKQAESVSYVDQHDLYCPGEFTPEEVAALQKLDSELRGS